MSPATLGDFHGRPTLTISTPEGHPYPVQVSMGVRKAELVLAHLDELRAFVADYGGQRYRDKEQLDACAKRGA